MELSAIAASRMEGFPFVDFSVFLGTPLTEISAGMLPLCVSTDTAAIQ